MLQFLNRSLLEKRIQKSVPVITQSFYTLTKTVFIFYKVSLEQPLKHTNILNRRFQSPKKYDDHPYHPNKEGVLPCTLFLFYKNSV